MAAEIATLSARGQFAVSQNGVEEMVIDKGYHALRYCGSGEWPERPFAHQFEAGLDGDSDVRGREKVQRSTVP